MHFRLISVIASSLIIVVGLIACQPITEETKVIQKPSRSELSSEINNTCFIYANLTVSAESPPSSSERSSKIDVVESFLEFAQLSENAVVLVNLLELKISMMAARSAMDSLGGRNVYVNNRNIEASCISLLREKAL